MELKLFTEVMVTVYISFFVIILLLLIEIIALILLTKEVDDLRGNHEKRRT